MKYMNEIKPGEQSSFHKKGMNYNDTYVYAQ